MAKKTRKIHYDFFQLNIIGSKNNSVFEIFEKGHYKPLIKDGSPIEIFGNIEKKDGIYTGILIHSQMNELAPSFDTKIKKLNRLNLSDYEGLASPKCFLFDKKINILMFESGKGISLNRFLEFFEFNLNIEIDASIVLDPEKIQKYERLDFISKIELRVAKVQSGELFKGEKALSDISKIAEDTNSNKVDYVLHADRRGTLKMEVVRKMIKRLTNYRETAEVEKLKVTGREEGEHRSTFIDFITNRFRLDEEYDLKRHMDIVFVNSKLVRMKNLYINIRERLIQAYL
jgi:hypothetical protein